MVGVHVYTVAEKVRDARSMARLTASDLARLVGTSVATVSRVEAGKQLPSADLYLRMLGAAGFVDDGTWVRWWSRPSATWTARWLLGVLDDEPFEGADWVTAWQRIGLVTNALDVPDPESLLFRAGRSARLALRPGAVTALGGDTAGIADQLTAAGIEYAVTGDAALERLGSMLIPVWPVVYVADVGAALAATGLAQKLPGAAGSRQTTFLPFDEISETGRLCTDDGIWWADPVQAVLDGYGGYGRMVEQAQHVVEQWSTDQ